MAFPRLQELAAVENSNNLTYAILLIAEINVFGGPLALQCAEFLMQLSQTEVLKMLEIRNTIMEVHIQVHKKIDFLIVMRGDDVGLYLLWFYVHGDDDVGTWVQKDGTKTICIDCWFEAQPGHGMSFDTRPKPFIETMWVHYQMHHSRMGHTTTNKGLAATGLGVRSTTAIGLAVGSFATGSITVPEVIDDCMSLQHTDSSEDETGVTEPPATHGTRSPTSKSFTK
ncbi:hypothetical protein Tco_0776257 [Tanacetum coccineum]|uniref:Uncharacterized protein n=1 Tax=Tanacetum coccineum TaxID=301880 RepID=A0ABQ5H5Z8_9ASTR